MTEQNQNQNRKMDMKDPLFTHPAEISNPLSFEPKLEGMHHYHEWKREMELNLATRRKLGFVTSMVKRSKTDPEKAELWDLCNDLVVSWILNNLKPEVKAPVRFITSAKDIWDYLGRIYGVANGARKFQVEQEIRQLSQGSKSIAEYYNQMSTLWQTLENLVDLPPLTELTEEVLAFSNAVSREKEKRKLFQFLNGLDPHYTTMRSNLLMKKTLPTVQEVVSTLQQEEIQQQVLNSVSKMEVDTRNTAFYGQQQQEKPEVCPKCKKPGHKYKECWFVIGFPEDRKIHGKGREFSQNQGNKWQNNRTKGKQNWNKGKSAANALVNADSEKSEGVFLSQEQFIQLVNKMSGSGTSSNQNAESEMASHFAGLIDEDD